MDSLREGLRVFEGNNIFQKSWVKGKTRTFKYFSITVQIFDVMKENRADAQQLVRYACAF
jgi:hypothetical protein